MDEAVISWDGRNYIYPFVCLFGPALGGTQAPGGSLAADTGF